MMVKVFVYVVVFGVFLVFWANTRTHTDEEAKRILSTDGISNIELTGYAWFSCAQDDWTHTGFRGIKNGQRVEGALCGGLIFKNNTLRYK